MQATRLLQLRHDPAVLIHVETIEKSAGSTWLAQVRTPFGHVLACWCGDPAAEPGEFHVEWTVDEEITWGHNAGPAVDSEPQVRAEGSYVILRGKLELFEDGNGALNLGGTSILLDFAVPLPEGADGSWVELRIDREKVELYPENL